MEDKETRRLSVPLAEDELRAKALELADQLIKLDDIKMGMKVYQKKMKDDIEALEKKISVLTHVVQSGKEDREVECIERRNHILMTIETYRVDTGEMVATRPMTQNERQLTMFPKLRVVEEEPDLEAEAKPEETQQEQVVNGEPQIVEPPPDFIAAASEVSCEALEQIEPEQEEKAPSKKSRKKANQNE